jgi:hypothetical protein
MSYTEHVQLRCPRRPNFCRQCESVQIHGHECRSASTELSTHHQTAHQELLSQFQELQVRFSQSRSDYHHQRQELDHTRTALQSAERVEHLRNIEIERLRARLLDQDVQLQAVESVTQRQSAEIERYRRQLPLNPSTGQVTLSNNIRCSAVNSNDSTSFRLRVNGRMIRINHLSLDATGADLRAAIEREIGPVGLILRFDHTVISNIGDYANAK